MVHNFYISTKRDLILFVIFTFIFANYGAPPESEPEGSQSPGNLNEYTSPAGSYNHEEFSVPSQEYSYGPNNYYKYGQDYPYGMDNEEGEGGDGGESMQGGGDQGPGELALKQQENPLNFLNLLGTDFQPGRLVNIFFGLIIMLFMMIIQGYAMWVFGIAYLPGTRRSLDNNWSFNPDKLELLLNTVLQAIDYWEENADKITNDQINLK